MNPALLSKRQFLWESLLLGGLGALAGAVVGKMTVGVLNSANFQVPLSVQLLLTSDTLSLSVLPTALAGAIALIAAVTVVSALNSAWRAAGPRELTLTESSSHECARFN